MQIHKGSGNFSVRINEKQKKKSAVVVTTDKILAESEGFEPS